MFTDLTQLPDDPILRLGGLYRADQRTNKVDIGVGVFQNEKGHTPIMRAVKAAEQKLWQDENSKTYLGLAGNVEFNDAMKQLILGDDIDLTRVGAIQSVAGTGGLCLLGNLIAKLSPQSTVWVPDPTWGNHVAIFASAGLAVKNYTYYDAQNCVVNEAGLLESLSQCQPKDVVILHGCCHNPTGADLSPEQWHKVANIIKERNLVPIVDLAYLGFGQGIHDDAYGLRYLAKNLDNVWIVASCSKNFGLYRERTGVILSVAPTAEVAAIQQSYLANMSRVMVSLPPNHGAGIVSIILNTPSFKADWLQELHDMSAYIKLRRQQLVDALAQTTGEDWSVLAKQQGMFSMLPLGEMRVQALREAHGVYMVGAGRINFAGLKSEEDVGYVAESIASLFK